LVALARFVIPSKQRSAGSSAVLVGADVLSRYLTSIRHYSRQDPKRVTPTAFLPSDDDGTTSTYHTSGLTDEEIWSLGHAHVHVHKIYGRGDVAVSTVTANGLVVDADYEPTRHVNIAGWPRDVDDQLSLAQSLAAEATLHLHA